MSTLNPHLTEINNWLNAHMFDQISHWSSISGGCISQAFLIETQSLETQSLETNSQKRYFAKTRVNTQAPNSNHQDMYVVEAAGLAAMAAATDLTIPTVLYCCEDFILMEYLDPQTANHDYWSRLAVGLAKMHSYAAPGFGFDGDNYCGDTPQPNPRLADGFEFFSQQRLLFQAQMARQKGLLTKPDTRAVETLCAQLRELLPLQDATLIHGDLWSGNIMSDSKGNPALIDPAAYWGWAKADIAMTLLFGGFKQEFYDTYNEHRPMAPGWQQRMEIYNLYHLLNHLNLFGGSYLAQVRETLGRYV